MALTDSVALVDAAVGIFAKFLMNFKAALTSSAVLSGGSLGTVLGRLLSSELDRERERFGMSEELDQELSIEVLDFERA